MSRSVGSNPTVSAIKGTSFVYHSKRRSFCVFSNKTRKIKQNRASERSIDFSGALFFVFRARKRSKTLVYFLRFLALQGNVKSVGAHGLEPKSAKKERNQTRSNGSVTTADGTTMKMLVDRIQIRNEGVVVEFKCGAAIEQEYVK